MTTHTRKELHIKYKGKYYILEIKTESSYKWRERTYVDDSHIQQAIAYSLNLCINDVLFLYECRDLCSKKCYLYTVTDKLRKEVLDTIKSCDDYVSIGVVPMKPQTVSKKTCQYCQYRKSCKMDGWLIWKRLIEVRTLRIA